MRLAGQFSRA